MMRIGVGLLALMGLGVSVSAQAQMTLPGKFEVTDTGSASYTIPISLVPGTAGLEPKLSLHYDSRSGNGLLGLGWSLAGLPAITRCGKTIAQDGVAGGVAFDVNDRFCLDGQRLIATSGTYGADQAEYRTERESFSKVISYGTAGSGPSWFKVWTKAGLVMEFGNSVDSKIEAQGKSSVRVWALNRTSDTKSNYFTVSYTEDNDNGEYRPNRIDYTGNADANTQATNSVRFVYETRPDIVPMYQAGSMIKTTKRMVRVQAWQASSLIREYQLDYVASGTGSATRISQLKQCDAGANCQPFTTFVAALDVASSFPATAYAQAGTGFGFTYTAGFNDFNGDGRADAVLYGQVNNNQRWDVYVALGRGDGTFDPPVYTQVGTGFGFAYTAGFGDFNGDGKADAVLYGQVNNNQRWDVYVALGRGDGTFDPPVYTLVGSGFGFAYTAGFGDFNGDGRADAVLYGQVNSNQRWDVYVALGRGDGTFDPPVYTLAGSGFGFAYTAGFGDLNGDGKADAVLHGQVNSNQRWDVYVALGRGDGTFGLPAYTQVGSGFGFAYNAGIRDFNGDGKADAILYGLVNNYQRWDIYVALGRGDGTFASPQYTLLGAGFGQNYTIDFGDLNGDGITDAVLYGLANSNQRWDIYTALGTGSGFAAPGYVMRGTGFGQSYRAGLSDFNGDGRDDAALFGVPGQSFDIYTALRSPGHALVTDVGNATGSQTSLSYKSVAAAGGPYVKGTGASACAYPCVDVQGPLYVVSEVNSSNGLGVAGAGGEYRSTYRYAGAKADQHGRGFLGFRQMTVRDEQTGVEQTTTYRQDYPFTGLVASREKTLGMQPLNRSTNSYSSTNLGGTRRYPFLTASLEESWELTGAALPAVTTAYQYDTFGNATQVIVSTDDGHVKTTVNTYDNTTTGGAWLLGRLRRSEVTSTTPGN